ncbi:MAG: spore germination protein [Firmicutes bacterium]|nr:spore germination protein [Bacillota bacterium]
MNREVLAAGQVMAVAALSMIGVAILTAPGTVAVRAGPDAWLSFAVMLALSIGAAYLMLSPADWFPGEGLVEYTRRLFGKPLGTAVCLVYSLLEMLSGALVIRLFAEVVGTAVLAWTPLEVTSGVMLLLVAYLCMQRVRVFGRVNALFLPTVIVAFYAFIISVFQRATVSNLTPVLARGLGPVASGAASSAVAFQGFEAILYFGGYADKPREAIRAGLLGVFLVGAAFVLTCAGVLGIFGHVHLAVLQWPVLEAMKVLGGMPGEAIERYESLFVTVWMIAAFTSAGALVYAGTGVFSDLTGTDRRLLTPIVTPLLYTLVLAPNNVFSAVSLASVAGAASLGWATVVAIAVGIAASRTKGAERR